MSAHPGLLAKGRQGTASVKIIAAHAYSCIWLPACDYLMPIGRILCLRGLRCY